MVLPMLKKGKNLKRQMYLTRKNVIIVGLNSIVAAVVMLMHTIPIRIY